MELLGREPLFFRESGGPDQHPEQVAPAWGELGPGQRRGEVDGGLPRRPEGRVWALQAQVAGSRAAASLADHSPHPTRARIHSQDVSVKKFLAWWGAKPYSVTL